MAKVVAPKNLVYVQLRTGIFPTKVFQDVEKLPIVCWFQEDSHDFQNPTEMIQKDHHCNKIKSTQLRYFSVCEWKSPQSPKC